MSRTWTIVRAFALKDFRVAWSYRASFVAGALTTFYGLIMFRFVSELVKGPVVHNQADYFRFVVVGIVLTNVLRASTDAAVLNVRRDQVEGTLEILAAQPVSVASLALGWSAWPVLEALVDAVLTLLLAIALGMGALSLNLPALILTIVVTAVVFLSIGFVGAAIVLMTQQGGQMTAFATSALALISGTFFPVSVLPGWLEALSHLSPLTYALNAMRGATLGGKSVAEIGGDLAVVGGFAVVLLPLSILFLSLAFDRARRRGTLARF